MKKLIAAIALVTIATAASPVHAENDLIPIEINSIKTQSRVNEDFKDSYAVGSYSCKLSRDEIIGKPAFLFSGLMPGYKERYVVFKANMVIHGIPVKNVRITTFTDLEYNPLCLTEGTATLGSDAMKRYRDAEFAINGPN
jgi:hypothetical protein